jgi:hypothetical protein
VHSRDVRERGGGGGTQSARTIAFINLVLFISLAVLFQLRQSDVYYTLAG